MVNHHIVSGPYCRLSNNRATIQGHGRSLVPMAPVARFRRDAGEKVDKKGGLLRHYPPRHAHYAWTGDDEAIVQVQYIGPGGIDHINAPDDPGKSDSSGGQVLSFEGFLCFSLMVRHEPDPFTCLPLRTTTQQYATTRGEC